jgi:hypothetical protein
MSKPPRALTKGFNSNDGDGGPQTPLDHLIRGVSVLETDSHPIFTLHHYEEYFSEFSIDLKVEACKKILRQTEPESLLSKHVSQLLGVQMDYPRGYLVMALDDMNIEDFRKWLTPLKMKGDVVRPRFGP